jgi:hypothetical protein
MVRSRRRCLVPSRSGRPPPVRARAGRSSISSTVPAIALLRCPRAEDQLLDPQGCLGELCEVAQAVASLVSTCRHRDRRHPHRLQVGVSVSRPGDLCSPIPEPARRIAQPLSIVIRRPPNRLNNEEPSERVFELLKVLVRCSRKAPSAAWKSRSGTAAQVRPSIQKVDRARISPPRPRQATSGVATGQAEGCPRPLPRRPPVSIAGRQCP